MAGTEGLNADEARAKAGQRREDAKRARLPEHKTMLTWPMRVAITP